MRSRWSCHVFCTHWWTKLYSRRSGSWLDAAIAYNLDKDGNVALNFAYKTGRQEETAKKTDLFKSL
jgi:hypothetical protein